MEITRINQLSFIDDNLIRQLDPALTDRSGSFTDNMKLPFHRWFRYSAGFSANWVRSVLREKNQKLSHEIKVLDPFAGVATTLIASAAEGVPSVGFEAHPFVYRIAEAKIQCLNIDPMEFYHQGMLFLKKSKNLPSQNGNPLPNLLIKCYDENTIDELLKLKNTLLNADFSTCKYFNQFWLLINSILRVTSHVGTAQWQYVLPNKRKAKKLSPFFAFEQQLNVFVKDISHGINHKWNDEIPTVLNTDARDPILDLNDHYDIVITSPPYPNNYDYADATRLEMTFWGDVTGWKDLHPVIRRYLITSCSQHSAAEKFDLDDLLSRKSILPIKKELSEACYNLAEIRKTKGGKKTYHTMAAAYFDDLANVFIQLRKICHPKSELCFVIGDSAPYGVYLAVDKWFGELALAAGFSSYSFNKIRDRNVKWKNRKHRVPLKEGRLWIKG